MKPTSSLPNHDRHWWRLVAALGFLSVLLGAFGAHGLRDQLEPSRFAAFQTGISYQFYHVFALALGLLLARVFPAKNFVWVHRFFLTGIVLFSGSLYVYAVTGLSAAAVVTPFGGVCFLIGWLSLALKV